MPGDLAQSRSYTYVKRRYLKPRICAAPLGTPMLHAESDAVDNFGAGLREKANLVSVRAVGPNCAARRETRTEKTSCSRNSSGPRGLEVFSTDCGYTRLSDGSKGLVGCLRLRIHHQ